MYLFTTSGMYVDIITAPDGANGDLFGHSVDVSGDIIVVGSHLYDDNGYDSGSAYIFTTSVEYVDKITASDGTINDYSGYAVSVFGDTFIVGSPLNDSNGLAYSFTI